MAVIGNNSLEIFFKISNLLDEMQMNSSLTSLLTTYCPGSGLKVYPSKKITE